MENIDMKKYWMRLLALVFVVFQCLYVFNTVSAVGYTYKAGFDCEKAQTETEKYICSTKSIAELDFILNEIYTSKLKNYSGQKKTQLKKSQKTWLRDRNSCIGNLPTEKYFCMLDVYRSQIVELGGLEELIAYYVKECAADEWSCGTVGDLMLGSGRLSEAIKYYSVMCEADRDGDAGGNCYKKASVLEKQGKISEAKTLYEKTCQARQNNEACGAALRLGPKLAHTDQWSGLYKNMNGTLFIKMLDAARFSISMDTHWANGHVCGFGGAGIIKNGQPSIDVDPDYKECTPVISKNGNIVSLRDPTGKCRTISCGARGVFEGDFTYSEIK